MIITYMRSSSYNAFSFCEMKYYLDYCLSYHSPANKAAQKGSIVHKAMEVLAQLKLARQRKEQSFYNQELKHEFDVVTCTPGLAIELAYKHYTALGEYEYTDDDYTDCRNWMWGFLLWNNGMFSPLKVDVIAAEQYFDITIKEEWAKYYYRLPDGKVLEGYLGLKGTLDLVTKQSKNVIEIIDWKTGSKRDWIAGKNKTYEDLHNDPQFRLYHYAATKLYPKANEIFFTIFYVKDGGPQSLCFQKTDLIQTEKMIRERFETIKNTYKPKLIWPNKRCGWCYFSNHNHANKVCEYNDSICNQTRKEIVKLGIDKVTAIRNKDVTFNSYNEGGGKTH